MLSPLRLTPVIASLIFMAAHSAKADGPPGPEKKEGWNFSVGAATIYTPTFTGSKDYETVIFPNLKAEYGDKFSASPGGIEYNLINNETWRVGPIVKSDFGRKEKDDNALKGLGDMDATAELGGFVEYNVEPFSASFELRQGAGGHEGLIGEAGLNYKGLAETAGPPIMFGVGPRVTFADSNYNNAYFGINQTQAANSGLAQYNADSGVVSYGVGGFAMMPLSQKVSLMAFGGYDRLGDVATDSPLIKAHGDNDQFKAMVGVNYAF